MGFVSFERVGGELLFQSTTAPPRAARRENEHNSSFRSGSLFQRDFDQFLSIAITA
jgi:hypothetical protein